MGPNRRRSSASSGGRASSSCGDILARASFTACTFAASTCFGSAISVPSQRGPSSKTKFAYSGPGNDQTRRFPLIVDAIARLRSRSCIIDGEAVACDDNGVASFDLIRHHRAYHEQRKGDQDKAQPRRGRFNRRSIFPGCPRGKAPPPANAPAAFLLARDSAQPEKVRAGGR